MTSYAILSVSKFPISLRWGLLLFRFVVSGFLAGRYLVAT